MKVRVVSIPCWELFDEQSAEYQESVLPSNVTKRVGVELGLRMGWDKYIGRCGKFIGMKGFGASGPIELLLKHFGVTVDAVVAAAKSF